MIHSLETLRTDPTILHLQLNYRHQGGKKKRKRKKIWKKKKEKKFAMWCHLTFRCQSNWLTGKKNQQQKACSCQSQGGRLPAVLGRAGLEPLQAKGMRQSTGWAGKPCARVFCPWERQGEGISHLLEHPSSSSALQHRILGPSGGADPLHRRVALGRAWGVGVLPPCQRFWPHSGFFPVPVQDEERWNC